MRARGMRTRIVGSIVSIVWRDKREQYGLMLRKYPQLMQRIALKDLAAYLFLTPQSLSRIRAGVK